MVHVLFLFVSLLTVALEQALLLKLLPKLRGWRVKQALQIVALGMPMLVMFLFSLTMSPVVLNSEYDHASDHASHQAWLLGVTGFSLLAIPVGLTLIANLIRLGWLYLRTWRNTWEAPSGMETLVNNSMAPRAVRIRLWHSARPFAFNLPGFFFSRGIVVLSTGLVGELDNDELQAVIWHEQAHLVRRDFWTNWFINWWAAAFFYMPAGRSLVDLVKKDQELACDEKVASFGGATAALALADALLKVWEKLLATAQLSGKASHHGFQAPGLTADDAPTLTEQRVTRLMEFGSSGPTELILKKTPFWSRPFLILTFSLTVWSAATWIIHLLCPELS